MPRTKPLLERLLATTRPTENGCMEWTGYIGRKGYGHTRIGGRKGVFMDAHRAMWVAVHGSIPQGLMVLHRCDNRPCINIAHLFLGTARDNYHDGVSKGRIPVDQSFRFRT
jgi:hypothetical protein